MKTLLLILLLVPVVCVGQEYRLNINEDIPVDGFIGWNEKGDIIDCLNTSVFDYYVGAGMDISKNKDAVIVIDEVYNNIFSQNPANEAKL